MYGIKRLGVEGNVEDEVYIKEIEAGEKRDQLAKELREKNNVVK